MSTPFLAWALPATQAPSIHRTKELCDPTQPLIHAMPHTYASFDPRRGRRLGLAGGRSVAACVCDHVLLTSVDSSTLA